MRCKSTERPIEMSKVAIRPQNSAPQVRTSKHKDACAQLWLLRPTTSSVLRSISNAATVVMVGGVVTPCQELFVCIKARRKNVCWLPFQLVGTICLLLPLGRVSERMLSIALCFEVAVLSWTVPGLLGQVETFNNKLCSDLLLVLQPVDDDGTNLSAKAQPSLWTSYLYPAAAFILQLYLAFLHRLAHTAWSWFGAPAQSYVNAVLQGGMKLLRMGPGALKQAPAPSVHVSSAILASSSQKLADILLPRMAQAAAKAPVAGEGKLC